MGSNSPLWGRGGGCGRHRASRAFTKGPVAGAQPTARGKLLRAPGRPDRARCESLPRSSAGQRQAPRRDGGAAPLYPEWFRYYGGLADKIEGRSCRATNRHVHLHQPRAARRGGGIVALELAAAAPDMEAGASLAAGNTVVIKPSEHTSARRSALSSWSSRRAFRRRLQYCHGLRRDR